MAYDPIYHKEYRATHKDRRRQLLREYLLVPKNRLAATKRGAKNRKLVWELPEGLACRIADRVRCVSSNNS